MLQIGVDTRVCEVEEGLVGKFSGVWDGVPSIVVVWVAIVLLGRNTPVFGAAPTVGDEPGEPDGSLEDVKLASMVLVDAVLAI